MLCTFPKNLLFLQRLQENVGMQEKHCDNCPFTEYANIKKEGGQSILLSLVEYARAYPQA